MTFSASHVPSIPSRQMTLTLARDGVLASRQGGPCEASPATQIFGFSQPPALVEPPSPPPLPSLPRSAQARLSSTTTLSVACRILKKHKQRTVPLPPSTRAPPPYQLPSPPHHRLIFAPSLPTKPPKHTLFFQPHHQRRGIITLASSTRPQRHPSRPEILTALPATMSGANSWLARQRKSDLVELAQTVGLKEYVHFHPQRM